MALSRRGFVAGGAGLMAGAAFGLRPAPAFAQVDLGPIHLDVVSDGSLTLPGGFIFDPMPQDELAPIIYGKGQEVRCQSSPRTEYAHCYHRETNRDIHSKG